MELVRQKNVATCIAFPIVDADGDAVSGAADLDSEIDTWSDDATTSGFGNCSAEATEIGSSGVYYLLLTAEEMNADYIYVQAKTSTTGAKTQHILIRTMTGDPLELATTESGRQIDVETTGKVGLNFDNIKDATEAHTLTNITVPTVASVTNLVTANTTQLEGSDAMDQIQSAANAALVEQRLDHLVAVADADDPVDNSLIAKLASTDGDWSNFSKTTDSLQSVRNVAPHGTAMRGTDGASKFDHTADKTMLTDAAEAQIDAIEQDANELQTDWADGGRLDSLVDAIRTIADFLQKWTNNKIVFTGSDMVLYDDDGTTPLKTWALSQGNLSVNGPYNRAKAT